MWAHWLTACRSPKNLAAGMLASVLWAGSGMPASAHPHVWIDADAQMVFEDDKITAIRLHWVFDDLFSLTLIDQFDKNHDLRFFDAENTDVHDNAFALLSEVSWLTHLRRNEEIVTFSGATDFKADITDDRRVSYDFTLTLKEPLDPIKDAIALSVYDAEFYIDVAFTQVDPILFRGNRHLKCHYEMSEDEKNRIYFDLVSPIRADLACEKQVADASTNHGLSAGDFVSAE
ncbi:ABC-type uncharacterized transport system substrate-binding protein [Thalassospira sp. 11-3]|jgi:ABC-type uncharacterized transport system substrate-binding protein|nr:protein of unknown function DUF1007 [Thalassospira sp. KO164]PXX30036.1 ABC-type uncharacterized transport system substrate-binding protein [Thalassospira sp. 11-3]SEE37271.1 Protein of unknown function [Thalassospira permensis]